MPTLPGPYLSSLTAKVINLTGQDAALVNAVTAGYLDQIRHGDKVTTKARLMVEIKTVSEEYGRTQEIGVQSMTEYMKIILTKFAYISVSEIREAFRYWASRPVDKTTPQMYGGQMDAAFFTRILSEYTENRKKVLSTWLKEVREAEEFRSREERRIKQMEGFEEKFAADLEAARANLEHWQDVPAWWYESATARGLMEVTPEQKAKAWAQAKEIALAEAKRKQTETINPFDRRTLETIIEGGNQDRAIVIAKKMLVFDWIKGIDQ